MKDYPYSRFHADQLILRDYLAKDRTVLSNERTLLGYFRTALGAVAAGLSLSQFFDEVVFQVIGWLLLPAALAILVVGLVHYKRTNDLLRAFRRPEEPAASSPALEELRTLLSVD